MQFYDATNKQGLCQLLDDLCGSDDTSYPRVNKTRDLNIAKNKVIAWIIQSDGTWQFDDSTISDAPRGKGTLVEGREYYTFASDYLQIEAIDILDLNTRYIRIKPYDPQDFENISPDDYFGVDSSGNPQTGMPECYDIKGDSIRLYPAPSATYCTLANGIRVSFKRKGTQFTVASDTSADTTESGIDVGDEIIAFIASIPYCIKYHPQRVAGYKEEIGDFIPLRGLKKTIIEHYSSREKNRRGIITTKRRAFR